MTALLLLALLSSPAEARKKRLAVLPPPQPPIVAQAEPTAAPTEGSLWNDVVARQLAGMDGNARRVGLACCIARSEKIPCVGANRPGAVRSINSTPVEPCPNGRIGR